MRQWLIGGTSLVFLPGLDVFGIDSRKVVEYSLSLDSPTRLFDGETCWAHPRAGIVPGAGKDRKPRVVITMNSLDLSGSDVFRGVYGLQTDDLGKSWTSPTEIITLAPVFETIDGVKRPVAVSDFWPRWHKKSGVLLGTGHTVAYTPEWKVTAPRPRHTSYSVYDPASSNWSSWQKLEMPDQLYRGMKPGSPWRSGCSQKGSKNMAVMGAFLLPKFIGINPIDLL